MNRADYDVLNNKEPFWSRTDWHNFIKVCKKYARQHKRPGDEDDFASYAAFRKVRNVLFRIDWVFTDYLREYYGDSRISIQSEMLRNVRFESENFDLGSIVDNSELSRPDACYEIKIAHQLDLQRRRLILIETENFDDFVCLSLLIKGFSQKEISDLLFVSESRITQRMNRVKNWMNNKKNL